MNDPPPTRLQEFMRNIRQRRTMFAVMGLALMGLIVLLPPRVCASLLFANGVCCQPWVVEPSLSLAHHQSCCTEQPGRPDSHTRIEWAQQPIPRSDPSSGVQCLWTPDQMSTPADRMGNPNTKTKVQVLFAKPLLAAHQSGPIANLPRDIHPYEAHFPPLAPRQMSCVLRI